MLTQVIYDNTGKIVLTQSGDYPEYQPQLFLAKIEVPAGKILVSIDAETGNPIFMDIPKTPEQQRLDQLEQVVNAMTGGTTE